MAVTGDFRAVLSAAIEDMLEHGFDSVERVQRWLREIQAAAERSMISPQSLDDMLREGLTSTYRKLVDTGKIVDKFNPGVDRFTLDRVRPALRAELDRRIMASADLIKLRRGQAIDETLRRFSGWSTSIPKGGTSAIKRGPAKQEARKALAQLPFVERRVLIDQGHKLLTNLNEILATDGGAIAGLWRSNWRQPGYDYREPHKKRDDRVYLVRDSWAHKAGLVKPRAGWGYVDQSERPGFLPFCRCYYVWLYALRDLPEDMLTAKGKMALFSVIGQEEVRSARRARADAAKMTKDAARYVGPFGPRPTGERCDGCTMWKGHASCESVEGHIDPAGHCRIFEARTPLSATDAKADAVGSGTGWSGGTNARPDCPTRQRRRR